MATEAKHTPGPWRATPIYQETKDYCIHAAGIPWQLAYLRENSEIEWPIEANARLIAAAPDLLAALKAVAEEVRNVSTASYLREPTLALVMDALAKAGAS